MLSRETKCDRWRTAAAVAGFGAAAALGVTARPARAQDGSGGSIERSARLAAQAAQDSAASRNEELRAQLVARFRSLKREYDRERLTSTERGRLGAELSSLVQSLAALDARRVSDAIRLGVASEGQASSWSSMLTPEALSAMPLESLRSPATALPKGWIGINVEAPHVPWVHADSLFIRYFDYPQIVSIEPNSPAARAGIAPGDVLVAYDGADVRERTINVSRLLVPRRRVMVTVSRDGDKLEYPLVVARVPNRVALRRTETNELVAPAAPAAPPPTLPTFMFRGLDPARAPIAGASLEDITNPDLGRIFGVSAGVLVTDVYPGQARDAGLRGGDVIVNAGGRDVRSIPQLRAIIQSHAADRAVDLEIVRHHKKQRLVLRW